MKEDAARWDGFITGLIARGLTCVRPVVGDRRAGLADMVGEPLPKARYRRCMARFIRGRLPEGSPRRTRQASDALKAVSAMESRKPKEAATCLKGGHRRNRDLLAR